MRAIRFRYSAARYLWTRWAARRRATAALGRFGCVGLDEVEPPALPGPEWVRVRTLLSGICGSDLAAITAADSYTLEPFAGYPFTFGHENLGRIVETGPEAGDWKQGDRVVVNPMLACAQRGLTPPCPACARGEYGLCRRTNDGTLGKGPMIGFCPAVGGGWSAGFVAHRSQLRGPGELDDETALLTDPFASSLRPVLLHPPGEDDVVLVMGAGTIGLLTVCALRLSGWEGAVAVLGRHDFQLERARSAGADPVFRSRDELFRWAESLPHARGYRPTLAPRFVEGGPSLIYDTVGSQRTARDALALAREGGRIVMVGGAARVAADWTRLWYRQLSVFGVVVYGPVSLNGVSRDIYDVSLELLRRDGLTGLGLVTHVFPVEEYRAAISAALDKNGHRSVKVAFRPEG